MPEVGNKKFPYTPKGVKQAKAVAKKTGKKLKMKPLASSDGIYVGK